MNKKIFTIFLCLFFSISTCVTAQSYSGGSGTESDPYLISSKTDMEELANKYSDKYFLLTQDITEAVVTSVNGFGGTFDGNGHSINIAGRNGVFSSAGNATIKNLNVVGNISGFSNSTYCYVGGICGQAINTTIMNCTNSAKISGSTITETNTASVTSYVGGICGYAIGNTTITSCTNIASVSASAHTTYGYGYGSAISFAGGICGMAIGITINNCLNIGNVSSTSLQPSGRNSFSGGICVGAATKISNCISANTTISSIGTSERIANFCYIQNNNNPIFLDGLIIENCYALASMLIGNYTQSSQNANSSKGKDINYIGDVNYIANIGNNLFTTDFSTCSQSPTSILILKSNNIVKWQRSVDNEQSWTDIDCTSFFYTETSPAIGQYIYRVLNGDGTFSDYVKGTFSNAVPSEINTLPLANVSKRVDESVTFNLELTDDNYSYQWYKGNVAIKDATSNTYSIPAIKISDAGVYYRKIQNGCNEVSSSNTMLIVDKAPQTITLLETTLAKFYGDEDFYLPGVTDKNLTITYTSSNTNVVTIANNKVHIVGLGTTTITASQQGNSEYISALPVTLSITVNKGQQVITFDTLPKKTYGDPAFMLLADVNSKHPVVFESSNTNVATISNNILTIQNAGMAYITASVAGNDNYFAATPVQQQLIVNKATQTITLDFIPDKTYGEVPFTLHTRTSAGELPITYISSEPTNLLILGNQATILKTGNITITAQQAGNNNYLPASDSKSFTVSKANLTILAENKERYYGDENPELTYIFNGFVNNDGRTNIQTLPTIICSAKQSSPAGNYAIIVSGATDNNYNFIYQNAQLAVNKAPLTIKPNDISRRYGESNPTFMLAYSGFKNDENESFLDVLPTTYCIASVNSSAGFYDIILSGGSDKNYEYNLINGKLEITNNQNSVSETTILKFSIYPNPIKDEIFIKSDLQIEKVEICSLTGITLMTENNFTEKINVSVLPQGVYLLKVYTDEGLAVSKIVKK